MALATAPAGQAQSICIEALIGWLPEAHMATLRGNPVAWLTSMKRRVGSGCAGCS
jgi:hypothetical protein